MKTSTKYILNIYLHDTAFNILTILKFTNFEQKNKFSHLLYTF